jgi:hypothetical protein
MARRGVPLDVVARMRRAEAKAHARRVVKPGRPDLDDADDDEMDGDADGDGVEDSGSGSNDDTKDKAAKRVKKRRRKASKPSPFAPKWSDSEVGVARTANRRCARASL